MVRNAGENALAAWFAEAEDSMLSSLVRGLLSDRAAVAAVVREPRSNRRSEGQHLLPFCTNSPVRRYLDLNSRSNGVPRLDSKVAHATTQQRQ